MSSEGVLLFRDESIWYKCDEPIDTNAESIWYLSIDTNAIKLLIVKYW